MEKELPKKRLTYIDTARAIAMLSVVIGHLVIYYRDHLGVRHPKLLVFIYTYHVPLFFVISGVLFSEKIFRETPFLKFLLKRIRTIVVPYLFLDITGGIYSIIRSGEISLASVKNVIRNTITIHPNVGENWFLSALFIGEIFLYFLLRYYRPIFKFVAWVPFLLIYLYFPFNNHYTNVFIRGVIAYTFMLAGYFLKDYFFDDRNQRWDRIVLSFLATYAISNFNGQIDIWGSCIGNPFLCLVGGLAGSYWIIGLSKNLSSKLLTYIGQNTMTMMGTHMICVGLVWDILSKTLFDMFPSMSTNLYGAVLLFVLVVALNLPIMYLYGRFLPIMVGKPLKRK